MRRIRRVLLIHYSNLSDSNRSSSRVGLVLSHVMQEVVRSQYGSRVQQAKQTHLALPPSLFVLSSLLIHRSSAQAGSLPEDTAFMRLYSPNSVNLCLFVMGKQTGINQRFLVTQISL